MAKISARGATKVGSFKRNGFVFTVCSDGRLLSRHESSGGYKVYGRLKPGVDPKEYLRKQLQEAR